MGNSHTADDGRVPDIQFEPMISADDVADFLRDQMPGKIRGLQQALMLATFDRPRLVAFLKDLDDDAMMNVVESAQDFSAWAKGMAEIAQASAIRSFVAVAELADMLKPAPEPDITDVERQQILAEFDRLDARAHELNALDDVASETWDAWSDEAGAALSRVMALPNTAENLRLRARAVGSGCENTSDLATLDLGELSAHSDGKVGVIVRQVLALHAEEGAT